MHGKRKIDTNLAEPVRIGKERKRRNCFNGGQERWNRQMNVSIAGNRLCQRVTKVGKYFAVASAGQNIITPNAMPRQTMPVSSAAGQLTYQRTEANIGSFAAPTVVRHITVRKKRSASANSGNNHAYVKTAAKNFCRCGKVGCCPDIAVMSVVWIFGKNIAKWHPPRKKRLQSADIAGVHWKVPAKNTATACAIG